MAPSAADVVTSTTGFASVDQSTTFPTLAGKVALITGSGRGIGKGIALELAARGAAVVINYAKSADKAQEVVKEISKLGSKAIALQADVSKPDEIVKMFEQAHAHFGHIDIVVSNSGVEVWSKEEDITPADFDHIFNINTRGQFFVGQQASKYLGRGGRLILMSSIAAQLTGIPNRKYALPVNTSSLYHNLAILCVVMVTRILYSKCAWLTLTSILDALYAGSKAAVEGFTRSFAVDLGEKGITVNAIAPGGVKTDMFDENAWVNASHSWHSQRANIDLSTTLLAAIQACRLNRLNKDWRRCVH